MLTCVWGVGYWGTSCLGAQGSGHRMWIHVGSVRRESVYLLYRLSWSGFETSLVRLWASRSGSEPPPLGCPASPLGWGWLRQRRAHSGEVEADGHCSAWA